MRILKFFHRLKDVFSGAEYSSFLADHTSWGAEYSSFLADHTSWEAEYSYFLAEHTSWGAEYSSFIIIYLTKYIIII